MIKPIIRFLARPFFLFLPQHLKSRIRAIFNQDLKWERRNKQLSRILLQCVGSKVLSGPFAGMAYIKKTVNSAYCPKILGCYEKELWSPVEEIISGSYKHIIDIGAAEGYYAVGLALQMPNAKITAFETDVHWHHLVKQLADLNGVKDKIDLRGHCSPEVLTPLLDRAIKTVIICDIEGAEMELMNPRTIPLLQQCDLLIETHDFTRPGISTFLKSCFRESHSIMTIKDCERTSQDCPLRDTSISTEVCQEMMNEHRSGVRQQWLWMKTNAPIPR